MEGKLWLRLGRKSLLVESKVELKVNVSVKGISVGFESSLQRWRSLIEFGKGVVLLIWQECPFSRKGG